MKKLATILMLVAVLFIGGTSVDAKTTKKKSTHKSTTTSTQSNTFGIKTFLVKEYGEWNIKSEKKIGDTLEKLGFIEEPVAIDRSSRPIIEDEYGDYITPNGCYCDNSTTFCVDIGYYEKNDIQVSIIYSSYLGNGPWFDSVMIIFPSKEKRMNFIKEAVGMGFKKTDSSTYYLCKGRCIGLSLIGDRTIMMCQDEAY